MRLSVRNSSAAREPVPRGQIVTLWRSPAGLALWTLLVLALCWPLVMEATPPVLVVASAWLPLVAAAQTLPIWLMRSYPALAWYSAAAVAAVLPALFTVIDSDPWKWPPSLGITLLAAFWNVCARGHYAAAIGAWVTAPPLFWVYSQPNTRIGWTVLLASLAMVSAALRAVFQARRALGRERELTEAEKARRTVLEERARIARDLHDVVAHHMSMVVVQAETAPYRLTGLSPEANADFAAISQTAREALNEVRGLLGVLRSDEISTDLRPQPGLADLDELVATAVRAGADAGVAVFGAPRAVRPGVDVGAYRIVQESLANAARHAPGAPVRIAVEYTPDAVEVAIKNDAPPQGRAAPGIPGHGLTGMSERAASVGGLLEAGPTPDGGYCVRARLPAAADQLTLEGHL